MEREMPLSAVICLLLRSLPKRPLVTTALRITIGIDHVIGGGGARWHNDIAEVVRENRLPLVQSLNMLRKPCGTVARPCRCMRQG